MKKEKKTVGRKRAKMILNDNVCVCISIKRSVCDMHAPYRKILTETKLITCESPTTLEMRSRRIRHGNTQQRCLCASSFCIREVFIEALSSRNFQSRPQFRSRSFLVASRKTHRPKVSASAVNLLRQKRKKRTLAETLHMTIPWRNWLRR